MRMFDLIAKKREGGAHSPEEVEFIARAAANGRVPDYQLSAWLMAALLRGMSEVETMALTRSMSASGRRLNLSKLRAPAVDKHSTGGVGDGISLALAPLVAALGVAVPMMSGRGLGHTGGTLDKLESIRGFRVRLPVPRIERQLRSVGVCMFGQSEDLDPADRKLYALRDATATVESMPLIVASILSKKLAEDLDALVLDIKCGSGAFMSDPEDAQEMGRRLVRTAGRLGLRCVGLITAMEQPLGLAVGNALEMRQAIEVLHGDFSCGDYVELLLALGGWMVHLAGKARHWQEGASLLEGAIRDGRALRKLREMIRAQGGDARVVDDPGRFLPPVGLNRSIKASVGGHVTRLDARDVGLAAVALGAGRNRMEDKIDFGAGIRLLKKVGDSVRKGDELARLYAGDSARFVEGERLFKTSVAISARKPSPAKLIRQVIRYAS